MATFKTDKIEAINLLRKGVKQFGEDLVALSEMSGEDSSIYAAATYPTDVGLRRFSVILMIEDPTEVGEETLDEMEPAGSA